MQLMCEAIVVFFSATLAAASLQSAFCYLLEREWPAVVFLTLAATATVWYGIILWIVVNAAFSI